MKLSKQETIKRHRMMWNWIAEETLKEKKCIHKTKAFKHFGWEMCKSQCWCCAYANYSCARCPVLWLEHERCIDTNSLYDRWSETFNNNNYLKASELAKQIANLPERKFEEEE